MMRRNGMILTADYIIQGDTLRSARDDVVSALF